MAGGSSIVMAVLLLYHYVAVREIGYSIYLKDQEFANLLLVVGEHKILWESSGIAQAAAAACLLPIGIAFVMSFDEQRPFMLLGAAFLLVAVGLYVDAYAHYGNMVGLGADVIHQRAPLDLLIKLADTLGDEFEILQYGAMFALGSSMIIFSFLMTNSEYYPRPISWLTFAFGVTAFFFTALPILFVLTRLAWLLVMGSHWLYAYASQGAEEEELEAA